MRPSVARRLVRARGEHGRGSQATNAPPPSRSDAGGLAANGTALVPRAKIAPPGIADQIVVRKQLLRALDDACDVITVCAPAGSGKTTLLADWVRTSPD